MVYKYALDCEMVGSGDRSVLARVSIVNENGTVVLDEYVKPTAPVTDYRTPVSGITKSDLQNGKEFATVRRQVLMLTRGNIVICHSLYYDFEVLNISHPILYRRDLAKYMPFREIGTGRTPSLKLLAKRFLKKNIQEGEHSSIEDARACMDIYQLFKTQWERKYRGLC